jgi:succinoglycan biosynthesis transport protein ExoP
MEVPPRLVALDGRRRRCPLPPRPPRRIPPPHPPQRHLRSPPRPKVADNPVAAFTRANVIFFSSPEQNFKAAPLVQKSAEKAGLDGSTPEKLADIQDSLFFYPIGDNTYRGQFTDVSTEVAERFLKIHVETYRDTEIAKTLGTITGEMDFLKERLTQVEKEMEDSELALQQFREEHADGLPEQAEQHYNTLRALEGRKIETEAELGQVALELKLNKEKLAGEKLFVESKVISTQRKTPFEDAIVGLKQDLAKARSAGMNDEHPKVKSINSLIEQYTKLAAEQSQVVDTETEKSRNPVYESIQDAIYQLEVRETVARNRFDQIKTNLESVTNIVAHLPGLQKKYAQLMRNYEVTAELQRKIFNQYKVTELQLSLEKTAAAARYDIITPPRVQTESKLKRSILLAVLGFIAGAAIGTLIGIVQEIRRYVASRT